MSLMEEIDQEHEIFHNVGKIKKSQIKKTKLKIFIIRTNELLH